MGSVWVVEEGWVKEERVKESACEELRCVVGGEEDERLLGKLKGEREEEGGVKKGVVAGDEGGNWKVEGTAVEGARVCSDVKAGEWDRGWIGVEMPSWLKWLSTNETRLPLLAPE